MAAGSLSLHTSEVSGCEDTISGMYHNTVSHYRQFVLFLDGNVLNLLLNVQLHLHALLLLQ